MLINNLWTGLCRGPAYFAESPNLSRINLENYVRVLGDLSPVSLEN